MKWEIDGWIAWFAFLMNGECIMKKSVVIIIIIVNII